ncbi:MAG: PH domain-containing protein [Dermatophilaceae bacterium]
MSGDPFEVFRPRRGRYVATALAVASVAVFTGIGLVIPDNALMQWGVGDRFFFASIGWVLAAVFWRYATIKAVPDREGLVVRNLFLTRRLPWAQIVGMQFGHGMPWPSLELSDTDQVAVMGIQRADGPRSLTEASRLAALIQALGEAREP